MKHRVGILALHRSFAISSSTGKTPDPQSDHGNALRLHLGDEGFLGAASGYAGFCGALGRLKMTYGQGASPRALDRYLWTAGMYRVFARGRRDINRDLLAMFDLVPRPADLARVADQLG
jgi:hypothetical protein